MQFVLCLCENGLCGCGLIPYADLLFNSTDVMLVGCELISRCRYDVLICTRGFEKIEKIIQKVLKDM